MRVCVLWTMMMALGVLLNCCKTSIKSLGSIYFSGTIWVIILPAIGILLVLVEIWAPAEVAMASVTTLANLSPMGTMVMPFMPRMVSKATMASERVNLLCVLRVM